MYRVYWPLNASAIIFLQGVPIDGNYFGNRKLEEQQKYASLDMFFLFIFALLFLIFNVVYWRKFSGYYDNPNEYKKTL